MRNLIFFILTIILVTNLSGCSYYLKSKSATERRQDMIISEIHKKYENKEIEFERLSIDFTEWHEDPLVIEYETENEKGAIKIGNDDSEINTMFDGFGNKTETRSFASHPLIKFVVVRTAPNGGKIAFVYSQSGEAKRIPEELFEKVLKINPNEIARAAEIYEVPKEKESLVAVQNQPNQPFPVRTNRDALPPNTREDVSLNLPTAGEEVKPVEQPEVPENQPEEKP